MCWRLGGASFVAACSRRAWASSAGFFPLKAEQLESLVNRLSAAARRRLCRFVS